MARNTTPGRPQTPRQLSAKQKKEIATLWMGTTLKNFRVRFFPDMPALTDKDKGYIASYIQQQGSKYLGGQEPPQDFGRIIEMVLAGEEKSPDN